ncbi:hypothetical protein [Rubidibacter lacunae]|uniref:hypothetical protein n=1 Tax=Rubidibacter lacunae TaxID=582514 RepID=UPI00040505C5|nr:hypothetical protein [Rubidibacter lacunae]
MQDNDADGDASTNLTARSATDLISCAINEAGAVVFKYFNCGLKVNRLSHFGELSDADATSIVLARLDNLDSQVGFAEKGWIMTMKGSKCFLCQKSARL